MNNMTLFNPTIKPMDCRTGTAPLCHPVGSSLHHTIYPLLSYGTKN
jgi:hypothetical protein